ncbi:MAG: membrane protein insertase YidC [Actinomycetes bacterium]
MIAFGLFEGPAWLLAKFYDFTHNYILAVSLIAFVVMLLTAPLQLKATKGMLEMQRLQPELRKLQQEHRGDRQKLNEEMMKLYQQHKVNPLASCFPLLLQFPVFIIMFQVLHGLTEKLEGREGFPGFTPEFIGSSTELYQSLVGRTEMIDWGIDLAKTPLNAMSNSFGEGVLYGLLVIALGALYFVQQRMVAARATMSPTMSATQQKIMQYLPVVFAVFLVFYLTGLVIYYMAQAVFRIGLQWYITKRFYAGEQSLGRQAQAAGERAREMAKADGGGGGLFAQAKRDLAAAKGDAPKGNARTGRPAPAGAASKRVTPPKNTPTPSGRVTRPPSTGRSAKPGRPTPPKKSS